jgi:hypothetical protein
VILSLSELHPTPSLLRLSEMFVRVQRSLGLQRALRTYARTASTHSLVFLEHNKGVIDSGSLSAVTAASKLGGTVTGLVVGGQEHISAALDKAKRYVPCIFHEPGL